MLDVAGLRVVKTGRERERGGGGGSRGRMSQM